MERPFFTVVMPAYGVEKYLKKAVDSIRHQTFSDWELIIVEDGSPDRTGELAERLAGKDSRIRAVHHEKNKGLSQARNTGIAHEEMHSKVEYVVAHGISSQVNQEKVVIGSYHFVFEDEKCRIPHGEEEQFESLPGEYSHLYLAVSQELAAVICIEDPLREEARDIVASLKAEGIKKVVMMTGDSLRTAQAIAQKTGVDAFYAEVLPEDKASFVEKEKALGRKVIMIGDGINDSPDRKSVV